MQARITILSDDLAGRRGLRAEHGLALWIEWGSRRILFDTGQGLVLFQNADELGIDLGTADAVVLSHGHYDHTGGVAQVLARAESADVYAHPAALNDRYAAGGGAENLRSIGMSDADWRALEESGRLVPVTGPTEVFDGFFLTGPIPRVTGFEDSGGVFFTDPEGREPDLFPDDQAAYFASDDGVSVVLGCSHAGVVNTLLFIQSLTDNRPLSLVLGGTHLGAASEERLDRTIEELRRLAPMQLVPIHCTGSRAAARFLGAFPGSCTIGRTGRVFETGSV